MDKLICTFKEFRLKVTFHPTIVRNIKYQCHDVSLLRYIINRNNNYIVIL